MADESYLIQTHKRCCHCGVVKSLTDFYVNRATKDGLQSTCKECSASRQRAYNRDPAVIARRSSEPNRLGSKTCKECDVRKSKDEFYRSSHSADRLQTICKDCSSSQSQRYNAQPEIKTRSHERDQIRFKQFRGVTDAAKSVPCARCGGSFPVVVMDFHHRDPATKLFTVAAGNRRKLTDVIAEIAKCDVLCANCHRIVEWGESRG